jgi:phosphate transport system permease protein
MNRRLKELAGFGVLHLAILLVLAALLVILGFIGARGIGILSWEFLTQPPRAAMTKGGILPAILGTLYLSVGAILAALPLGIGAAIYLVEYARPGQLVRLIRLGINNLAGVPSIVFGLFGFAVFVKVLGFGVSILSGALTLGIVILPVIIRASEEALIAVPSAHREASFALGATRWETVSKVVLSQALPGILTAAILGVGRAAGETAPILFTAVTFYQRHLPNSLLDETMALPYHIYALMTEGTKPGLQVPIAYGTAVVLLILVLTINLVAIVLRSRYRARRA